MTVRIPPKSIMEFSEVWTINFRETAPALSNTTMYKGKPSASRIGGLAVGVPGELRGLEEAHRRWGTIPWKRLVEPSAKLAAGWRVQRELARRIQVSLTTILQPSRLISSLTPDVFLSHVILCRLASYFCATRDFTKGGGPYTSQQPCSDAVGDR